MILKQEFVEKNEICNISVRIIPGDHSDQIFHLDVPYTKALELVETEYSG